MTTHSKPTIGETVDQGVPATSYGWQADLHVTAVDGGDVTVTIQDSADGRTWADLAGGAFAAFNGAGAQRLIGGPTDTVRRYLRAKSAGGFTSATFHVGFVRHEVAQDYVGPLFEPMITHAPGPASDGDEAEAEGLADEPEPAPARRTR